MSMLQVRNKVVGQRGSTVTLTLQRPVRDRNSEYATNPSLVCVCIFCYSVLFVTETVSMQQILPSCLCMYLLLHRPVRDRNSECATNPPLMSVYVSFVAASCS
jgi:hypothetical protein